MSNKVTLIHNTNGAVTKVRHFRSLEKFRKFVKNHIELFKAMRTDLGVDQKRFTLLSGEILVLIDGQPAEVRITRNIRYKFEFENGVESIVTKTVD